MGESETSLATRAEVQPAPARHGHHPNESLKIMKRTKFYLTILALAASTAALSAADAAANWEKNCQKCHGADGKGKTPMGKKLELKDMTDAKYQDSFTDEKATKAIKEGIKDGDKTRMKPAEGLSDDEIKALVAKVRAFKT
jgi:cytochrome c553